MEDSWLGSGSFPQPVSVVLAFTHTRIMAMLWDLSLAACVHRAVAQNCLFKIALNAWRPLSAPLVKFTARALQSPPEL